MRALTPTASPHKQLKITQCLVPGHKNYKRKVKIVYCNIGKKNYNVIQEGYSSLKVPQRKLPKFFMTSKILNTLYL